MVNVGLPENVVVEENVPVPVSVKLPESVRDVAKVVVPEDDPRLIVVALPPIFKVVAVSLNIYAVCCVVLRYPPLANRFPPDVMSDEQLRLAVEFVIKQYVPVVDPPPM